MSELSRPGGFFNRVLYSFSTACHAPVMPDDRPLTPASPEDLQQALAHALQYDGKRAFRTSGEMMAKITAAHLLECLGRAGFVVMKKPPLQARGSAGLATKAG